MTRSTTNPLLWRPKGLPHCRQERKTASRNWVDLPRDLTLMIISRLDTFQILTSAQRVCRLWRSICMDPLMWRTINMCDIRIDNSADFDLEKMCMNAIDRSCGLLEDISIEYFGSDDLLKYIIDSQCQLRRLRLVLCFYRISDEGLVEIAQRLPMLEELDITLCRNVSSVALEGIGRGCPLLKSLKYNDNNDYYVGDEEAFVIAQNMPNLRHLQLVNNNLDNSGVSAILDGCSRLESLDLRCCENVELEGELRRRCDEQLKDFIEPNTSFDFRGYEFYEFYDTDYDELASHYRYNVKKGRRRRRRRNRNRNRKGRRNTEERKGN
ncbi:hypothetical protein PIB30_093706 [Stylosanthes scabra]|uniref:F-box domain-containing protein n=1 Tax=Stylosanthes scabra TaxID=79078 RepID=A0ABU6YX27_9FABA|nr:hypothetical protein [Stylosanthes scabra]